MVKKRIFVSATNRGLKSFRLLASQSLRKRGYDVDDEAIFNLTWVEITERLEQRIAACDAVVCLIGVAYGGEPSEQPPDEPRRSYSQLEYLLALKLGKPVYRLMAGEKTPFDADALEPESDEFRRVQNEFRAEVIRDKDWRAFASVDQLRAELAELRFPREGPAPEQSLATCRWARLARSSRGAMSFLMTCTRGLVCPAGGRRPL